jgi:hypothetical protein
MVAGLATVAEFGDYHLQLQFKWGDERFGLRASLPFDSGLLYHGCDNHNPGSGWLESVEFGILEGGETGDFWSVPSQSLEQRVTVDVEGIEIPAERRRYPNEPIQFRPGATAFSGVVDGILNSDDNEKPHGEWNTLDLYCVGQTSVHVVNGTVNLVLRNIRRRLDGHEVPLTRGRLQLQSEWAEVYFRNIRLRPIAELPDEIIVATQQPPANTLTDAERADGWRLLFDGNSLAGWRSYGESSAPEGWQVANGALTRVGSGGDLITTETFDDFELSIDWKISHGGNSGIFYRAVESGEHMAVTSPEFEIRDNAFWLDDPYTSAACYALYSPSGDATRPVGYWNHSRIFARGNHVEHWVNGTCVVRYERDSPDWKTRLDASKFRDAPQFARADRGHIGFQDHGDLVWFRNIKLRPLAP